MKSIQILLRTLVVLSLTCCGGGGTSSSAPAAAGGSATSSTGGASSTGAASGSTGTGTSGGAATTDTSAAAALATRLGKPARLLIGLGSANVAAIQAQGLKPDIYEEYLVGATGDSSSWPMWNAPAGAYVNLVAAQADAFGAVPMFTLYQMATNGDGNLADLTDTTFMTNYWANVVLLFQRLAIYGKPALVNFEPDFWGYVQQQTAGGDPTQRAALVTLAADCASLPNTAVGVAGCLVTIARKYAPLALVGFPPSDWGANGNIASVVSFMNAVGAGQADFVVMQTLDRDAGCFEAQDPTDSCIRAGSGWYWDETNTTHPNFQDHLANALTYHQGLALPLVWWQTPMGVPSTTPGGSSQHWRDNRVHYFLTHAADLVAAGGLGVVFGPGETYQTDITTDGGQYQILSGAYLANPALLP
jgi:hypothetical protein